jgi:enolase
MPKIQSYVLAKSLYAVVQELAENKNEANSQVGLVVNCLQGGKAIGSKCKVFKYSIVGKNNLKDPYLAQAILGSVRKSIVSGKGGEAALKFAPDGTFICPVDSIMDNLKIVDEAINSNNGKEWFGVGLSWAADTLYNPDTKKYES